MNQPTFTVTNTNDSGEGSLRNAITQANLNLGEDVINFDSNLRGETIALTSGQFVIEDDLIIEGLGKDSLTISGQNTSRIFLLESTSVDPKTLTITDLTLEDGLATLTDTVSRGGAIQTEHQGKLTVENVIFRDNQADDGGGAISSAFEGELTVIASQFLDNEAIAGNDERGAGAIAFFGPGQLTVSNTDFIGNRGINGAAINNLNGRVEIDNSRFLDNDVLAATVAAGEPRSTLRGYGGAIFADRASARDDESGGTIRLRNSQFEGNQGRSAGGAVYVFTGGSDRLEVINSTFRDNMAVGLPGGEMGNSGAIELQSNEVNQGFVVLNSEFIGNRAVDRGGASRTRNAPTTIINSIFADNGTTIAPTESFTGGVGGALQLGGNVTATITNSTFRENFAMWVGGAIGGNAEITVNNSIFDRNRADNGINDWNIQQQAVPDLSGVNNLQFPEGGGEVTPNIQVADPMLDQSQLPSLGSRAIDGGDNSLLPTDRFDLDGDGDITETIPFDERGEGFDRIVNGKVDLGALERQNREELVFGSTAADSLSSDGKIIFAGAGLDQVEGSTDAIASHRIYGGSGDDELFGGSNDRVFGNTGNDRLSVTGSNNRLYGGEGNDRLFVGAGGGNILTGGEGSDQFSIATNNVPDASNSITDFTSGEDIIGFEGFPDLTFNDLTFRETEGNTVISFDTEIAILFGIQTDDLSANDFEFV